VEPGSESQAPVVVFSADSHVGPRLREDLRPYCPKKHLRDFDDYADHALEGMFAAMGMVMEYTPAGDEHTRQMMRNLKTSGHYDVYERLREMDADGVAAEVMFHGSGNSEPIPFLPSGMDFFFTPSGDLTLTAIGYHIYNCWLADACSVAPDRLLGAAHLPLWDLEAAIKEAEWAASAGLRVVNLSAPRPGILDYDHPTWEPLWSLCESAGMTLTTHGGAPFSGGLWAAMEANGYGSRRSMPMLIFGGVFERHPSLNLVLTEILLRNWWVSWARELDLYWSPVRFPELAQPPSDYVRRNVFLGASFAPPAEVASALDEGYADNFVWGRDYPHPEGTYQYPESDNEANMNRACLCYTFAGVAPDRIRAMVGDNGIRAFHLDGARLAEIAVRIGAPTLEELGNLPEVMPDGYNNCLSPHPAAAGQPVGR